MIEPLTLLNLLVSSVVSSSSVIPRGTRELREEDGFMWDTCWVLPWVRSLALPSTFLGKIDNKDELSFNCYHYTRSWTTDLSKMYFLVHGRMKKQKHVEGISSQYGPDRWCLQHKLNYPQVFYLRYKISRKYNKESLLMVKRFTCGAASVEEKITSVSYLNWQKRNWRP